MAAFEAFMYVWNRARSTYGEGTPTDGAQFDQSGQFRALKGSVESAAPGGAWTGDGADAYGVKNTQHATKLGSMADLDQRLGTEIDRSAAVVSAGRVDLENIRQFTSAAADLMPANPLGEVAMWALVAKSSMDVANTVYQSHGDLSAIGQRVGDIATEYGALEDAPTDVPQQPPAVDPLDEILRKYQTAEDPGGAVDWEPGWPLNQFTDPAHVTATEARMLDELSPFELRDLDQIKEAAAAEAIARFPPPTEGDTADNHTDAFRHTYWNALMTQRFGEEWTRDFTTAHEGLPGNPATAEAMDLHNNELGRQIAMANPDASPAELADLVENAVNNGDTVVIAPSGDRLEYSNNVDVGGAGHTTANTVPGQAPAPTGTGPGGTYDPGQPGGTTTGGY